MSLMTESRNSYRETYGMLPAWLGENPVLIGVCLFFMVLAFVIGNGALLGLFMRFAIYGLIGWFASSMASLACRDL